MSACVRALTKLRVWFKGYWNNKVKQDLRKGKADIFAIQSHIAHFIIGNADGGAALENAFNYEPSPPGAMSKVMGFLNDAHMKDPAEMTSTLRSSPALLQNDESIEAAFQVSIHMTLHEFQACTIRVRLMLSVSIYFEQCGRDLFLISTKRIIVVDKKGISGKSVEYKSYPLMYNKAFRYGQNSFFVASLFTSAL